LAVFSVAHVEMIQAFGYFLNLVDLIGTVGTGIDFNQADYIGAAFLDEIDYFFKIPPMGLYIAVRGQDAV